MFNNVNIIEMLVETLEGVNWDNMSKHDLHYYAFNEGPIFIYYREAEEALEDFNVFEAIKIVMRYEEDMFGDINTDFSNPCDIANMFVYIRGEEILYHDLYGSYNKWLDDLISTDEFVQEIEKYVF